MWEVVPLVLTLLATPAATGRGQGPSCTAISSTGFTVLLPAAPAPSPPPPVAAYVGLLAGGSATPLSQPSALLLAKIMPGGRGFVATADAILQPGTAYTLRWRVRPADVDPTVNFGFGWAPWGAPIVCETLPAPQIVRSGDTPGRNSSGRFGAATGPAAARTLVLYRSSEFTIDDVDFLTNHSSGDARGEVALLSSFDHPPSGTINSTCLDALASACPRLRYLGRPCLECAAAHLPTPACGVLPPPAVNETRGGGEAHFFCGVGFPSFNYQSPLAEYTVDFLPFNGSGAAPSPRDPGFVPYTSCDAPNFGFANSPLRPLCNCQVQPDRRISRLNDTNVVCPPSGPREPDGGQAPACNCTLAYALAGVSEETTLRHIGQAPVYWPLFPPGSSEPPWPTPPRSSRFGSFFSTAAAGECARDAALGDNGCTWKMRPVVRVLAYADLLKAGWDREGQPAGAAGAEANVAAFEAAWRALDGFVKPAPDIAHG